MAGIPGVYIYDDDGNIVGATGGKLAAWKNMQSDPNFYKRIGAIGGKNGNRGGFAGNPELARRAGAIGGRKSRRRSKKNDNPTS